ncbi:hypothetical protein KZX37_10915 [Microbacterium sp. EYE_5]|uniref:hypothetical protein n=1 Tax=unclassified Microbacterium TaxID=2609290 RepID=UPI0020046159|nr:MULTISPECIES: hypothetical protein [unclassified Microbacterium]MCK6080976.1 hypothetical protein [Microbacterium sp. EYE_382]MCK6086246.1 hypothetical protein [Microbacterium sp. EYE_384]MCK6124256.1 hypothetical protein [Microbacterium sp. EYE_80]MCK6127165.1 hypothetical protein [Microbacterium sp. EYE_79]MCK6141931.1 hypothetical protein [Microbacterium sp. EYE_39]
MSDTKQIAGQLILVTADHDTQGLLDALRGFPRERNLDLIVALADTAAAALEALHGETWREALSFAMLDAQLDQGVTDADS